LARTLLDKIGAQLDKLYTVANEGAAELLRILPMPKNASPEWRALVNLLGAP
jgi:hypothetical protein